MQMLLELFFTSNVISVYGILGGYNIEIQDTPYQVNYGDICGGVLLHRLWAMTTAHCGTENYIRVGNKHRLRGPKIKIDQHIVHPKYGKAHKFDYDVQLLLLHRQLHFSDTVSNIKISNVIGRVIYVAGWGYSREKGDYTDLLQQAKLKTVPMRTCQAVKEYVYNHTLTDRMFCAGGKGKDACQGDSGGPAVSYGRLVGLSSFGFGCGRNIPGVFVNLANEDIRQWIKKYTGV